MQDQFEYFEIETRERGVCFETENWLVVWWEEALEIEIRRGHHSQVPKCDERVGISTKTRNSEIWESSQTERSSKEEQGRIWLYLEGFNFVKNNHLHLYSPSVYHLFLNNAYINIKYIIE